VTDYVPTFGTVILTVQTKDATLRISDAIGDATDVKAAVDRAVEKLLGEFGRAWASP
jgi:hypothetical protein